MKFSPANVAQRFCIVPFSCLIFFLVSCHSDSGKDGESGYAKGTKEGFELAKYHCATCHKFVPAEALDRLTWDKNVLPPMAARLGIQVLWKSKYLVNSSANSGALLLEEWQKIYDYYVQTAPERVEIPVHEVPVTRDSGLFAVKLPGYRSTYPVATIFTFIDTSTGSLFTSDNGSKKLFKWNKDLNLTDSVALETPVVHADVVATTNKTSITYFTGIGILKPNNLKLGKIFRFDLTKPLKPSPDTVASDLARPVYTASGDLNNDGLTDLVVCEFGSTQIGGLYTLMQTEDGKYQKEPLMRTPGASQVVIKDVNKDGWNDVVALFAYDLECIRVFINDKKGSFKEKIIMDFPPVNGSTSFQLADFNHDGIDDILYSCGDNADASIIFKPFHGIYIFLGSANGEYKQSYFYQINGCTKAVAVDFDNDGDLDIATSAYYADFASRPEEGFLYFEQTGPLAFKAHSPAIEKYGRWRTMDVNDYDKDGDVDIILGNLPIDPKELLSKKDFKAPWDDYLPFIVLENKIK